MGIEHTTAVPQEPDNAEASFSALLLAIKTSGILTLLGLVVGIGASIAWATTGGGDTIAFAALTIIMGLVLGGLFGTLGTVLACMTRKALHRNLWALSGAFAAPTLVLLLLLSVYSLKLSTILAILAVTVVLFVFGRWYVAPRVCAIP